MNNDETNESNAEGKEDNSTVAPTEKSFAQIKKEENDLLESELQREADLKAKARVGGRAAAGQENSTPEETATKEAKGLADEISGAFI